MNLAKLFFQLYLASTEKEVNNIIKSPFVINSSDIQIPVLLENVN